MAIINHLPQQQDQVIYDFVQFNTLEYHENLADTYYNQLVQHATYHGINENEINTVMQNTRENVSDDMRRSYDAMETHIRVAEVLRLANMEDGNMYYVRFFEDLMTHVNNFRDSLPPGLYDMVIQWSQAQNTLNM
jgi:hypothetical protein